mmetsp:Transcript_81224/g.206311  ORF Transcript_81224/g.206311 Transcript_81224/m.206311 type:complete len:184 (-) Transcript_81224:114-665(-)
MAALVRNSSAPNLGALGRSASGKRVSQIHDQAVLATHDRLNGVMRSHMDGWRVPQTSRRQRILHNTSWIVDTTARQKMAREQHNFVEGQERNEPSMSGTSWSFRHDGSVRMDTPPPRPRTSGSAFSGRSSSSIAKDRYLPPWVSNSHWDNIIAPGPPAWAGTSYAMTSKGPFLWAGAALPPKV